MAVPVKTGDYAAGAYAIGSGVEGDVDAIIAEMDGSIDADNLATNAVSTVKILNDAVDANKIKDGDVRETHIDYDEDTSGMLVIRAGPNYVDAGNSRSGRRLAFVSKSVTWDGTGTNSVTFTYASDCVDGDPAFAAVPNLAGIPVVASVEALVDTIYSYEVTASSAAAITFEFTDCGGFSAATVQIEFAVSGPV